MTVLTRIRGFFATESGKLVGVGLLLTVVLASMWLAKLGPLGDYTTRAVFGVAMVAAFVIEVVSYVRKRRSSGRTLVQTILARPLVAALNVVLAPMTIWWVAIVVRYGLASDAHADLLKGLGLCFVPGLVALSLARGYYDWRDTKQSSSVDHSPAHS